jgi:AraC-like DNA-binding protein
VEDFKKYAFANDEDKRWGLYLNLVGRQTIEPHITYPSGSHPPNYFFTWDQGRVLQEYQLIYITEGKGVLETKHEKYTILAGDLIILRKGEWHRYRPDFETGWIENFLGFDGDFAEHYLSVQKVLNGVDVVHCGENWPILDTYYKVYELLLFQGPAFQQIAAGFIIKLLGNVLGVQKRKGLSDDKIEELMQKVLYIIRDNVANEIDFEKMADDNEVSYSYLRKNFKAYTGLSPRQYHIESKLDEAKRLLLLSPKTVKEIAYDLGFESAFYFSRLFKAKTNLTPQTFKKRSLNL